MQGKFGFFAAAGAVFIALTSGAMAQDEMTLKVESSSAAEGLPERIRDAVREVTKLRASVELAAPGSLPNDGKVIEDARNYQ